MPQNSMANQTTDALLLEWKQFISKHIEIDTKQFISATLTKPRISDEDFEPGEFSAKTSTVELKWQGPWGGDSNDGGTFFAFVDGDSIDSFDEGDDRMGNYSFESTQEALGISVASITEKDRKDKFWKFITRQVFDWLEETICPTLDDDFQCLQFVN